MNKLYPLFSVLFLVYWGCEEQDTIPPTVTITFPINNTTVAEMISITCISSDNEGVEKVELWVNGVTTELIDDSEPYSFGWNTTLVDNGSYSITVRSFDTNENTTDSEPIVLTVDNTQSNPQPINITSVVFDNGAFTITWNQSTDGDFSSYELEKSVESTMGNYDAVYTSSDVTSTSYADTDVDPLVYQYYRIAVTDTFDYETKGEIVSSSLDPVPSSVDVESVEYTLEEMTISWSESSDGDFKDYKLLYSETESGDRDTVVTYTDKSTISHTITEFDPTHENWFWVDVSDTLGQTSVGSGVTNQIDSPPTASEIDSIIYENDSFIITWSQNNDDDFQSYTLYESESQDMSGQTVLFTSESMTETSFTLTDVNEGERYYYQIVVEDVWGLQSSSNIGEGSSLRKIIWWTSQTRDIWIMDFDGGNQSNLYSSGENFHPKFSPDGSKIVFHNTNGGSDYDILIMNSDGSNIIELSNNNYRDDYPRFSPDGLQIIYTSERQNVKEIYVMDIDGANSTMLTNLNMDINLPVFTPDGEKIVFVGYSQSNSNIYVMESDGSNIINLTNHEAYDTWFDISPDGLQIIFESDRTGNSNIFSVNLDGSNLLNLSDNDSYDNRPKFSPDGSKIVYQSGGQWDGEIFIMDVNGSNKQRLTENSISEIHPQFTPDGLNILYKEYYGDGYEQIYMMDINGGNQINLTNNSFGNHDPQIQPRP